MLICFCHMIKTAGTTLYYIFRRNFGINYVLVEKSDFNTGDLRWLLGVNPRLRILSGHSLRSNLSLESVIPGIRYITFLRHPVDRVISHYNFGLNRGYHCSSYQDFIRTTSERNYQLKFLIGKQNTSERDCRVDESDLACARNILLKDYSFVGIVEHFDESLALMKHVLQMPSLNTGYDRRNVTQVEAVSRRELTQELIDETSDLNEFDCQLYDYAVKNIYNGYKDKYALEMESASHVDRTGRAFGIRSTINLTTYRLARYVIYKPLFWLSSMLNKH